MEVRTLEHKDIEKDVAPEEVVSVNFIEAIINKDNETGKYGGRVLTRLPPEPNGYFVGYLSINYLADKDQESVKLKTVISFEFPSFL